MTSTRSRGRGALASFRRDRHGNVAMMTAFILPPLLGALGVAIDTTAWYAAKSRAQGAADAAAVAAAQELKVANTTPQQVSRVAEGYALANLNREGESRATVGATVSPKRDTVEVEVTLGVGTGLTRAFSDKLSKVTVRSTARISGNTPICMIGLDGGARGTVHLDNSSRISADRCAIYSDSKHPNGLVADKDAVATAALICSAGGVKANRKASFQPTPISDCPQVPDPLASRQAPGAVGCTFNGLVVTESRTLRPGVYCGGLQVTDGAQVKLDPGTYVVKDGPLIVDGGGGIFGQNTGFYLMGERAVLFFDTDSTISLTAPKDGVMAGLLFSEERSPSASGSSSSSGGPTPKRIPVPRPALDGGNMREHRILSDNAHTLLGTIYLPASRLVIDSKRDVAGQSAYTVVVVRRLELYEGPNLVLNSNYAGSDVPVPDGLGNKSGTVALAQ